MIYKNVILILVIFFYISDANAALVFDQKDMSFKISSGSSGDSYSAPSETSSSYNAPDSYSSGGRPPAYSNVEENRSSPVIERPVETRTIDNAPRKKVYFDDDNQDANIRPDQSVGNQNVQFDDANSQPKIKPQERPSNKIANNTAQAYGDNRGNNPAQAYGDNRGDNRSNLADKPQQAYGDNRSNLADKPQPTPIYKDNTIDNNVNYAEKTDNNEDIIFAKAKKYDDDIVVKPYKGIKVVPVPSRRPKQGYYCDYVVKPTDNLSIIGKHFNATSDEIAIAMGIDIKKQKPEVGKTYRIPVLFYSVAEDDTVDKIAIKNNVKAIEIKAVNQGLNDIKVSNIILLPIIDRSKIDLSSLQSKKIEVVSKPIFIWPVINILSFHREKDMGMMISLSKKSDVVAISNGIVVYVGDKIKKYGNIVIIKHDNGYVSAYGHLENITVKNNDLIIAGQSIGQLSKLSLYFTLKKNKEFVDPTEYLPQLKQK